MSLHAEAPTERPPLATVLAIGACQLMAFGTTLYLLAVIAGPIGSETGWSTSAIVGGFTTGVLTAASIAPSAGRFVSLGHGRLTLAASSILFATGLTTVGLGHGYAAYLSGWAIIGAGMGCGLYDVAFGSLGRRYGALARPAITKVAIVGGFASTIFWPLSGFLTHLGGWRGACLTYALGHLVISLPLYLAYAPVVERSSTEGRKSDGIFSVLPGERRLFAAVGAVVVLETAVTSIIAINLVEYLQSINVPRSEAIALGVLVGPAQVTARLAEMLLGGRLSPKASMAIGIGGVAVGLSLLASTHSGLLGPALCIYGGGMGIASVARGTLPLHLFGPVRFPLLMGRVGAASLLAQATAPTLFAYLSDHFSFDVGIRVLIAVAAANLVIAAYIVVVGRRPVQETVASPPSAVTVGQPSSE